ncbi:MAG TPA: PQQ-binding-like beta-propeller repeat protein [Gemmatimonadales bacterium]|nr:PQQ-binding-like beta-propeller repeat protein [Gemmatimonadales bacterium]
MFCTVNATACAPVNRLGPARQDPGWPAYLGTPRHDLSAGEQLNPDPRPLWKTDVGRAVRGSPALGEGVIAVGVAERTVVLLDRASGEPIWRQRVEGTIHAGPLLDGDRLYIATERRSEGRVYALRLRDARRLWAVRVGSVVAPLAADAGGLYGATEAGTVFRLDPETGRPAWRTALSGAVRAGPVPTPFGLAVATTEDTLYLLDRDSGIPVDRLPLPGAVLATPALGERGLFLGTATGQVLEVTLPDLAIRWQHAAGDAVYGAPALAGDTLLVLARNGRLDLIPIDAPGDARSLNLDVTAVAGPTPTQSGVLVASVSGEVLLVDPLTGAVRWRAQVDGPVEQPPLVLDRQVVVVGGRGDIHAYR